MTTSVIKEKSSIILTCLGFSILTALAHSTITHSMSFILGILSIILAVLYAYKKDLLSLEDFKFDWKRIGWIFFSFLLLEVIGELGDIVLVWEGIEETKNQLIYAEAATHIPVYLDRFLVVFVAPILEEVIFRGIISQLLFKNHLKSGYIIGAILFGLMHSVTSIGEAVIYIGGGLVFALACYRYGRVSDSILIHMIHNAL